MSDPSAPVHPLAALGGWPGLIGRVMEGSDLSADEARTAMGEILAGAATPAQLIALSVALRIKGETADELSGLLDAVLAAGEIVPLSEETRAVAIDVVGTGGDRSHSINVSTMSALVAVGAGATVCKHGARAASSKCGTADVLEALGVVVDLGPADIARCVEATGFGFCLAPRMHPAFRFAAGPRREVGVPLMFNLLGPMANPGRVRRQLIGVADATFAERMLATLRAHGSTDVWVVHGGGLDELTTTGTSSVLALDGDGAVRTFTVDPVELGLAPATLADLVGGDPTHNAAVVDDVLGGSPGAARDIVVLNAGAALVVAGLADSLADGVAAAAAAIDDGRAAATLTSVVAVSQDLAAAAAEAAPTPVDPPASEVTA